MSQSSAPDARRERRSPAAVLKTVLEFAVVVVFGLLIWNNYTLRRERARSAAAVDFVRGVAAGERIGVIPALALDGRRRDLDLRDGRAIVAIVKPGCASCDPLIASARNEPDVHVLSVASLADTRALAKDLGPDPAVLAPPAGGGLAASLQIYPQLFVIDRGQIVRTCARIEECR